MRTERKPSVCQECGMRTLDVGEFHPYAFCVLYKAGLDPWKELRWLAKSLGLKGLGTRRWLVRELPKGTARA